MPEALKRPPGQTPLAETWSYISSYRIEYFEWLLSSQPAGQSVYSYAVHSCSAFLCWELLSKVPGESSYTELGAKVENY
jgi:hypothetical protein